MLNSIFLVFIWLEIVLYIAIPYQFKEKKGKSEYLIIFATILATSQLPLDWDYESDWQNYPYPIIFALDVTHSICISLSGIDKIISLFF